MSTKEPEVYKKHVIHIEMFPDDVLSEVLRHATWVPYGINPMDMVEKRFQSSYSRDLTKKYRASLVTRRYLVRVCKKWHRLAFLYLYEWVMASKLKNLAGIVQVLEQQLFGDPHTRVGWCTRRLDIDFRWTGGETLEELYEEGSLVLRLLRAVPNLQILTGGSCFYHLWITPSLSHTYCPKLEFFSWMGELNVFGLEDWTHFVQSHPNLIAVNAFALGSPSSESEITTQTPPPPHGLRELTIGLTCPVSIDAIFPSLNRLTINLYTAHVFATNPRWRQSLITSPLPSLTSLQLNLTNHVIDLDSELESVEPLFPFLPNLRRVDLVLLEWPKGWSGYTFPSSVSVLGLRVCSAKPKRQVIKRLLQVLDRIVRDAVSPLRVQLLDEKTMQGVRMHEAYIVRNAEAGKVLQSWLDPDANVYRLPI